MVTKRAPAKEDEGLPLRRGADVDLLARLQRISEALVAPASVAAIGIAVIDEIVPALEAAGGVLALISAERDLEVVRTGGYGEVADRFGRIALDAGLPLSEAVRTVQPIWVESAEELRDRFPVTRDIPSIHESAAAVPLVVGSAVVGVLGLSFAERRTFDDHDRAFLVTVAQQCAIALERSRLETAERERRGLAEEEAAILEAVERAGVDLIGELDLATVLQAVTDAATRLSGAHFGAFFFNATSVEGDSYLLYSISGVDPEHFAQFPMPRATEVFGPTFRGEGTIRLDDVRADPRYGRSAPYHGMPDGHLPVVSYLAVPVVSRAGTIHGGLFFGHPEPGRFTAHHERLVDGIARHAAVAVDNALQYQAQQIARADAEKLAVRLGRIQELAKELSRAMTVDEVVRAFTDRSVPDLRATSRGLWLLDDEQLELRLADSSELSDHMRERFSTVPLDADLPSAEAVRTRKPVFVGSEVERDARYAALQGHSARGRSFVVLPLLVEDRVLGVLSLGFESEREFDSEDEGFFIAIGEQCALALDRARLYESERRARDQAEQDRGHAQELARVLQTSLLPPSLPDIPGVELAARYHPALEGIDVGGDFYDVFDTGGDWALVMGDVCGKGPEAAALTALARYTLRSVANDVRRPAAALRRLNEILYRSDTNERFCTVAYGRLISTYHGVRVSVSCGGHLPPLVLRADGEVEAVGAPGYLIGIFPDVRLWDETVTLVPGDAIVFYTDGVTEARRDRVELGEDGLREVLRSCQGFDAAGIAQCIEEKVLEYGGPQPRDDLALLVARVVEVS